MTIPTLETITSFLTIFAAVMGALLAALWLSLIIWAFRDMRARSRDPFAQILAALVVAALPFVGIIIYFILRPPETLAQAYERALEEEALLQEIEERPSCPGCSRTIDANWILCPYCHTRLRKACPDCHALMELSWNLCPFCGNQHVDPYRVELPNVRTNTAPLPPTTEAAFDDYDDDAPTHEEEDDPTAVPPVLEEET
ncbi:MAG: zinc ribbon domain-containing protein [Anaerolineales bacterium]|nr:zinc ribbon domain-containing protein [Anaerolineales bacterium]